MDIPLRIEQGVGELVARQLEADLGDRELLLTSAELAAAAAETAQLGADLLTSVIRRCYPVGRQEEATLAIEFDNGHTAARLAAALAFGAVTARVLMPSERDPERPLGEVELVCALFNLGIGLVDSVSDDDPEIGVALLDLVQGRDLAGAVEVPRSRGWLAGTVPVALADDPAAAFTIDVIEVFFETLHTVYPDDASLRLRRRVGAQLEVALEAERDSVIRSVNPTPRERLMECSRLTSVLPFQIIETLAGREHAPTAPTAGTQLGEAMWRIDDLVDLLSDARSGSLNGILLGAASPDHDLLPALEQLLASTGIADAAAEAAENLQAGLQDATDGVAPFLHFIQRYAGLAPSPP